LYTTKQERERIKAADSTILHMPFTDGFLRRRHNDDDSGG